MTCPKCQGLLVADPFWYVIEYQRVRCVNCGLHITEGWPVNLPPFTANGDTAPRTLVLLKEGVRTKQQDAKKAYMKPYMLTYMRAYRARKRQKNGVPNMMSHVL